MRPWSYGNLFVHTKPSVFQVIAIGQQIGIRDPRMYSCCCFDTNDVPHHFLATILGQYSYCRGGTTALVCNTKCHAQPQRLEIAVLRSKLVLRRAMMYIWGYGCCDVYIPQILLMRTLRCSVTGS